MAEEMKAADAKIDARDKICDDIAQEEKDH